MSKNKIVRSLPQRLAEYYDRSDSLAATEHSEEIRLLEARYKDLLNQISENDTPDRWNTLYKSWAIYENAANKAAQTGRRSDMVKVKEALAKVESLIKEGFLFEYIAWKQILDVMEQLRKTRETETKRRTQAASIISEKQVQQMIGYLISSINDVVSNEDERNLLFQKLKNINMY